MKRYFLTATLLILPVFLSGCSSVPGTAGSGSIWKSVDNGKTWEVKNQAGDKKVLPAADILSIVFSKRDKNKILFGTASHGIIKTEDGGESFELMGNFRSAKVYGLLIDPSDENIIYASSVLQKRGKIWKSMDSGKNWKEIYTEPANGPLVISMLMDNNNPKVIYASTSDRQIIKTMDGGETWKSILTGIGPAVKLVMDRSDSNLIYFITTDGKIHRSKDAGQTFEEINKNITAQQSLRGNIGVLEVDPSFGNGIYVAGQMGVIRSRDAGETWEKIVTLNNPQNFPVTALAINPTNAQELIVAVPQTTYRSVDGGATWATYQFNYPKAIKFLEYSPLEQSTIFLGFRK